MANAMYGKGREALGAGDLDWDANDWRLILLSSGYTVSINTHDFLDDVAGGAVRVATSDALASKTNTLGTLDAADKTFVAVTGSTVTQMIAYKHTGTESTSNLFLYWDTATGLSLVPNGGDVTAQWDNGTNKIVTI